MSTWNRSTKRRLSQLSLESLAERLTPAVGINNGTLEIVGGPLTDYVSVWEDMLGPDKFVHVSHNGAVTDWLKSSLPKGINFDGMAGNDFLWNTASVVVKAKGGAGNDRLEGGPLKDVMNGGSGNDILLGKEGNDKLYGEEDNDQLQGGADVDSLYGASGNDYLLGDANTDKMWGGVDNDTLDGGTGRDTMRGEDGDDQLIGGDDRDWMDGGDNDDWMDGGDAKDSMYGGLGSDQMWGGPGNDLLEGGNSNDFLDGGSDNDTLKGGHWDDTLKGGDGDDHLRGEQDDDDLYGETGNDRLYGGPGLDGLTPGYGDDKAWGEAGSDRFLKLHDGHNDLGWPIIVGTDDLKDVADEDAVVHFKADELAWTHEDLERVDRGMAILHRNGISGNARLLEMPDESGLSIYRNTIYSDDIPDGYDLEPEEIGGANFGGGMIRLYDTGMQGDESPIVHEIGHNWQDDGNPFSDDFKKVSSWTQKPPNENYNLSGDGEWWYDESLVPIFGDWGFVSTYAMTNPREDFAETWEHYFSGKTEDPNQYINDKLGTITDLLLWLS